MLAALWTLLGLVVGSFCNVVILRLPQMMLTIHSPEDHETLNSLSLSSPASHCPSCHAPLKVLELVPLLSFVWLKGKCSHCQTPISWQYPLVELLCAIWWSYCAHQFLNHPGLATPTAWGIPALYLCALVWSLLGSALLCLFFIDQAHHLLPDAITQPLLWTGLISAHWGLLGIDLGHALMGAVIGYASLSSISWGYKLATRVHGMGQGDMKLLAVFGAWIGAWSLIPLVFLASALGLVWALGSKLSKKNLTLRSEIAFGPFLITSFLVLLLVGPAQSLKLMGLSGVTPFVDALVP
jgi:leader peptidase (prepilin peptidase)/N-methyltransferase